MNNYPLETIRHSAAHVMAAAVQQLYPDAKFDIGPATLGWRSRFPGMISAPEQPDCHKIRFTGRYSRIRSSRRALA